MPPRPQPPGVRLPDRLRPPLPPIPAQQPLEVGNELLNFIALQLGIEGARIADYAPWQHTASEHQDRIREYLRLSDYDPQQADALERFVFEESCRLEQTASLLARAREFLKERRVLFPADSALLRLVGEQKKRAREHIVTKLVGGLSPGVIKVLDGLLEVKEGEAVSGLQGIKANPAKPSATAMQRLADKLADIEATGALAVDLSWLNANYQRALFHYVRKCSADRLREAGQDRRLAALVCFLRQSYRDAVDQAVDMFDKLLTRTHTRAEHELDDQMRGQRQTIKAALAALGPWGRSSWMTPSPPSPCDRVCSPRCPEMPWRPKWRGWTNGSPGRRATCSTASSGGSVTCGSSRRSCSAPWSSYRTPETATSPAWRPPGPQGDKCRPQAKTPR